MIQRSTTRPMGTCRFLSSLSWHFPGFLALVCLHSAASAATYYVAPTGSDSNNGSLVSPWQTLQKAASTMVAGDTCQIRGGTYRETVTVARSGASSAPITFQAYNHETVVIDGADPLTSWTHTGGNIWESPMNWTLGNGNQVFLADTMVPEARWPNAGPGFPWQDSSLPHPTNNELGDWSYVNAAGYDSNNQNGWFSDAQLPSRPDGYWNGATINMMAGDAWIIQSISVTAYADATRTLTTPHTTDGPTSAYLMKAGNEFYLTGIKGEMDSPGEWYYDPATAKLAIYSTTAPTSVTAKKRNFGFNVSSRSNIRLLDLKFHGCTVQSSTSTANITYDGLEMRYLGHFGSVAGGVAGSANYGLTLRNGDVLRNSDLGWDALALIRFMGSDIRVVNNSLHDMGYMPLSEGMYGTSTSSRILISHNTLTNSGRGVMSSPGRASIIEFNDMSHGMKLATDGAIFYANWDVGNSVFRYNKLHDCTLPQGHSGSGVQGFYLDSQNSNWIIHHNLVWNIPNFAFQINCRQNYNQVFNNTSWSCPSGSLLSSFPMNEEAGTHVFNNLFNAAPNGSTWSLSDIRYNIYNNTAMTHAAATDKGVFISGITSGPGSLYPVTDGAPDIGALEAGGTDWTTTVGNTLVPTDPLPTYNLPPMPFANQLRNGGFEESDNGPLGAPWGVTGSGVLVHSGSTGNAWNDVTLRSGAHGLKFSPGTTEVKQVVSGLLPNRRYKVYGGVQNPIGAGATVKLGVRDYGFPAQEVNAPGVALPVTQPGGDAKWWTVYNQAFITGQSNTTAEIYLNVIIPAGAAEFVYADDFCVQLMDDTTSGAPVPMPILQYALNETSGTTAYDATTHGRNGTVSGGATWVTGTSGNALNFNGTNAYLASPTMPTPSSEITVACWAKSNTATWNNHGSLVSKRPSFVLHPYLGTKTVTFIVYIGGSQRSVSFTGGTGFDITQWHHYAGVYSSVINKLSIYVDGELATSTNQSGNIDADAGQIYIGHDDHLNYPTSRFLDGAVDDIRIYDSAASASQLAAIVNADTTAKLHLQMDEAAGSTKAWDASIYNHNGVLTNMNASTAWDNGALSFNGSGAYVQAPTTVPTTPSESFTVSTWVKFNNLGTATHASTLLSNNNDGANQKGWQIQAAKTSPATDFSIGLRMLQTDLTGPQAWLAQTVPPGQWAHVAFVVDRSNGTITGYLNGVRSSSGTIPGGFGDVDTALGTRVGSGAFSGQLDDVRADSRVLAWAEVLNLAHNRANSAPSFSANPVTMTAMRGEAFTADLTASDPDPGDSFILVKLTGPAWLCVSESGVLSGTPGLADVGLNTFTVRVTDSFNASTTTTLNITVVNVPSAPVFSHDPIVGSGATRNVTYSGTLAGTATDADGDTPVYSKASGPAWLTVAANGSLSGTPLDSDVGFNVFTVQVVDAANHTTTATLRVYVYATTNSPPGFSMDPILMNANRGVAFSGNLSAADPDPGDLLTYSLVSGPAWLTVSNSGALGGTPLYPNVGPNTFTVRVTDMGNASTTATLNITVANVASAPVFTANPILGGSATQDAAYSSTLAGSATDPDGDALTYSKVSGPLWLTVASNGILSGTPRLADLGSNTFVVRVSDDDGTFATATFNLTVLAADHRYKLDNTHALCLTSSWAVAPPTSSDVGVWDGTVTAASTVMLGADMSWQGIRILNPGGLVTLDVGHTLTLGGSGIDMSVATRDLTINTYLNLRSSSQTWNIATNKTLTLTGPISGTSAILKDVNTGTLVLSGTSNHTGQTRVIKGLLRMESDTALGSTTGGTRVATLGQLSLNAVNCAEPVFIDDNTTSGFNGVHLNGYGSVANTLTGHVRTAGGVRIGVGNGGTMTFAGGISTTNSTNGTFLVINPGGGTAHITGSPIANGSGTLWQDQPGSIIIGVAGNQWGGSTLGNGTWRMDVANALPSATSMSIGGNGTTATLNLNGNNQMVGELRSGVFLPGSRTVTSATPATLTVNTTGNTTFDGGITGAVSLTKAGGGALYLTGTSSTAGTFTVNGGTLVENFGRASASVTGAGAVSNHLPTAAPLTMGGGIFQLTGRANGTDTTLAGSTWASGNATVTVTSTASVAPGQAVSGSGIPAGAFVASLISGTQFTLSASPSAAGSGATAAANSFTSSQSFAGLTLNPGASAVIVNANAATGTVLNVGAIDPGPGGTVNFTLPAGTQGSTNGITTHTLNSKGILGAWACVGNDWAANGSNITGGNIAALATYTDVARGGTLASAAAGNLRVTDTGSGDITPASAGTTDIHTLLHSAGAVATYNPGTADILRLGARGGILLSGAVTGTLNIGASNNDGVLTAGGAADTPGTIYLCDNYSGDTLNIRSTIADNGSAAVSLTITGAGPVLLSGNNTHTGRTTLGGQLRVTSEANLGANPGSFVADQFTLAGGSLRAYASFGIDDPNRGITLAATGGTLQPEPGITLTIANAITGAGPLTKAGNGFLVLAGANTHTGVTLNGLGILQIAHVNALQNSTLDTGANAGDRAVAFTASGTHTYHIGGLKGNDALAIGANTLSVGANHETTTFANTLSGGGGLIKVGNGTLSLSGANTYSGDTLVSGGMLVLAHLSALQNSTLNTGAAGGQSVNLTAPGTYNLGGLRGADDFDMAVASLSVGSNNQSAVFTGALAGAFGNNLTKVGMGTLTLAGANSYTGSTTVGAGTLSLGQACLDDTSAVEVVAGGILDLTFSGTDIVGALVLSGVSKPEGIYDSSNSGGLITGTGRLQVGATFQTHHAPLFTSNPVIGNAATQDAAYQGTLVGTATDADAGDTLTFALISGPAWLAVAADGYLTGAPALGDVGTNNFTVRVYDNAGLSAEATLQIQVATSNPDANGNGILDAWESANFGNADPGSNAAADDADHDGLCNLMEYALGSNPIQANAGHPVLTGVATVDGAPYLQLTVPKNPAATNLSYIVETIGDLTTETWASVPGVDIVVISETPTQLVVRDARNMNSDPQRFIRLRVVTNP